MIQYNPDTYCSLAFTGYDSRTKSVCCRVKFGKSFNSFNELQSSPELNKIQQDLLAGVKNTFCSACWQQEDFGVISMRQLHTSNKSAETIQNEIAEKKLKTLVIDSGNVCNLACRTCGPMSSSSWFKEFYAKHNKKFTVTQTDVSYLTAEDYQSIEFVSILGGEPFQNLDHLVILEEIIKQGYSKNCTLVYVTNGTIKLSNKIKNIFSNFKKVSILLSIDAVGKQFEYIRTNGTWDMILENVEYLKSLTNVITMYAHPTISALNIFYLDELNQWLDENNMLGYVPEFCKFPISYSFNIFNDDQKSRLIDLLSQSRYDMSTVIQHIKNSTFDPNALEELWFNLESTKNLKGLDSEIYIPRLVNFLKQ